jgi:hypothetical protein
MRQKVKAIVETRQDTMHFVEEAGAVNRHLIDNRPLARKSWGEEIAFSQSVIRLFGAYCVWNVQRRVGAPASLCHIIHWQHHLADSDSSSEPATS